ncbi:L,D-transpeptidase [Lacticaseibacillus pabuli]|uniref:L,D-transpeptidase n=1 Tax=Lacticaseibacillus pabuli TaxID=3025672 RepID=A0ABY7WP43_9LACO|nr:L,D-transpeptidase [Lacticaseibacillus sp. KACC 23028]WDF81973.1 L,D-transpeptidase [Lacticaseibacillus sp. KACC 23028]
MNNAQMKRLLTWLRGVLTTRKLRWPIFKVFVPVAFVLIIALLGLRSYNHTRAQAAADAVRSSQVAARKRVAARKQAQADAAAAKRKAAQPVNWRRPSQAKPYPKPSQHKKLWLDVDLSKQRVFLKDGHTLLYTMYASSGVKHTTPTGHFKIQSERGQSFFNGSEQMGANYYTSFYRHGVYLFHSVPTDLQGHYIPKEAAKLGKKPGSHGCVRLTVADAKWIFKNIKVGTKVKVHY